MVLEDSDDTVVTIVVAWLYTGRLRYTPENPETAQQVQLFSEGHGKKRCTSDRSKVDFEEPTHLVLESASRHSHVRGSLFVAVAED